MSLVKDATGNNLTYRIIGAAMAVHNELGYGYKEEVYEKALEARLNYDGIPVERQYEVHVDYEGVQGQSFTWIFLQKIKSLLRSRRSAINLRMTN